MDVKDAIGAEQNVTL